MEFKGKMVEGKLVVEAVVEEIKREDRTVDVVVRVPSLSVVNNFLRQIEEGKEETNG